MRIETNRLLLKSYLNENIQEYYLLKSCEEVWKYSTNNATKDIDSIRKQLKELIINQEKNNIGFCAVFEKTTNNYIGEAGILSFNKSANRCVIGYNFLPSFWNFGYATEITKALVQYAFHMLDVERVEALAMQLNTASCRVLEKSGLLKEGILKHFANIEGHYYDVVYYGIVKADYYAMVHNT